MKKLLFAISLILTPTVFLAQTSVSVEKADKVRCPDGYDYGTTVKTEASQSEKPEIPAATYTVEVASPGSLTNQLRDLNADVIEGLILKGRINGADLGYINKGTGLMGSLEYLNLKEVTFDYDGSEYATLVDAPAGGMGTTYVYHYYLSQDNIDKPAGATPTSKTTDCHRNNLAGAFTKHPKLTYVVLPDFLPEIGERVFEYCGELVSVEHGNLVGRIGKNAFYYATKLDGFEFPEELETVGAGAFQGTAIHGTLDLSRVSVIGNYAFSGTKITGVTFADRADIGVEAFAFTTDLTEVELPHPADSIKAGTFKFSGLQRIVIGDGAKFIGAEALGDASDITLPPTIEFLEANALPQSFANGIEAEDGIVYVGKVAYQSRGDQSSYAVKEGTLSLSPQVFGWKSATAFTLPSSLKSIGEYAFVCNTSLTHLTIPENVEYIGSGIARDCTALWSLEYNAANATCEANWLMLNDIEQIKIGDKVRRIPIGLYSTGTRMGNSNITDISLPASVEIIDSHAFSRCENLRSVSIPGRIKHLGESAFSGCRSLVNVPPIDVEIIPASAFDGCNALETVWLSDRTRSIGQSAFSGCFSLKDIHWPIALEDIGIQAFQACTSLEVVSLPENVRRVGNSAFSSCKSIKTVYIPSTLERSNDNDDLQAFMFSNDEARAVVTCMLATPPSIKDYYWPFNNRIAQVKVPAAHLDAYKQHPEWAALTDRLTTIEEIHAIAENSETSFSSGIDENTDLSDTTVGNVYITLDQGDIYDPLDGCIVLNSTMEEEYAGNIGGCIPGQSDLANRFNGLVIMVSAGDGTVAVDCKTVGSNRLAVKIGDNEPQYYTKNDKGLINVEYRVLEPTCVYIYGVGSEQPASLPRFRAGARAEASQNCLKIYRICVNIGSLNGIETAISGKPDVLDIYNLQGIKLYQNASLSDVYNLPRGIYIIGGKKIMIK